MITVDKRIVFELIRLDNIEKYIEQIKNEKDKMLPFSLFV
jgi:hypothetical protein